MYLYVIEDGEIVEKVSGWGIEGLELLVKVSDLCEEYFDESYKEVDEESGGMLYSVSDVEMVFVCNKDVDNVEDLWEKK